VEVILTGLAMQHRLLSLGEEEGKGGKVKAPSRPSPKGKGYERTWLAFREAQMIRSIRKF